ncbi:hypothetical protein B0T17DRAFT_508047 [Bombardia bombarda]|uniref:Uncharacterized protein n=1 Tax=Bombardia bombarda TaxID=252184 RepID=A0AA40C4R3_9PEZI|nr:hypothetical protein B0T17DRAFT_508047 [Bombardia bombarda]
MTGTITDESRIVEITRDSKDVDALTKLSSTTTANSIHSRKSAGSFDLTDLSLFHIPDHPLGRLSLCQFPWLSSSQQQPPTAVAATSASVAKLPSPSQGDSHTLSLSDEKRPIDVTAPFTCDECGKLCRDAKSLRYCAAMRICVARAAGPVFVRRRACCDDPPGILEAYGDVSGVGVRYLFTRIEIAFGQREALTTQQVIVSFVASACLVILLLLIHYLFVLNPELDLARASDDSTTKTRHPNPVDVHFLKFIRGPFKRRWNPNSEKGSRLESILNSCVLSLADVQTITGLAILVSGFISLPCKLSAYHWQIITHLAWLSSATHLATLTFLRNYLNNHHGQLAWRVIGMGCLLVLQVAAAIPTTHFDFKDPYDDANSSPNVAPSFYAICFFNKGGLDINQDALQSTIFSYVLLGYGFTVRAVKLSTHARWWTGSILTRLTEYMTKGISGTVTTELTPVKTPGRFKRMLNVLIRAALNIVIAQLYLFSSVLAEVYWLVISLAWVTFRLYHLRERWGPAGEDSWTFGQILPLALLAAPLVSIAQVIYEKFHEPSYQSVAADSATESTFIEAQDSPTNVFIYSSPYGSPAGDESTIPDYSYKSSRVSYQQSEYSLISKLHGAEELGHFKSREFGGTVFLQACCYLWYGLYMILSKPKGVLNPLFTLLFDALLYQPFLQALWITNVSTIWRNTGSKSSSAWTDRHRTQLSIMLLASLTASSAGSFFFITVAVPRNYTGLSLGDKVDLYGVMAILMCLYLGFWIGSRVWMTIERRLGRGEVAGGKPAKRRMLVRFFFSFVSVIIFSPFAFLDSWSVSALHELFESVVIWFYVAPYGWILVWSLGVFEKVAGWFSLDLTFFLNILYAAVYFTLLVLSYTFDGKDTVRLLPLEWVSIGYICWAILIWTVQGWFKRRR